jgi:hypothetical protein
MDSKKEVMTDKPLRCWEFKKCTQKDCPIYLQDAGEICYVIRKTLCGGKVQEGGFNKFMDNCITCDFYKLLKARRSQKGKIKEGG